MSASFEQPICDVMGDLFNSVSATMTSLPAEQIGQLEDTMVEPKLVSDELRQILEVVFYVVCNGVIGSLGCLANIVNILVFMKQGFKDSVTLSLLALALVDLLALLALVWESICMNPWFFDSQSSFSVSDVHFLTSAVPHGIFVRMAWWITTFVTFERCLCIVLPLKVKQIITPQRTVAINIALCLAILLGMSPFFIAYRFYQRPVPGENRTQLALYLVENGMYIQNIAGQFNVASQFGAFFIDLFCTLLIVHQLNSKSKWRFKSANANKVKDVLDKRDKKVIKMITLISIIFLSCLVPSFISFLVGTIYQEYSFTGKQFNLYVVTWSAILTLEAINSTVNIFVYYTMSSKYKLIFTEMFCSWKRETNCFVG
ncbi:uncharacterized protein LOC106063511 [Biomphalaria glabrata]|uniref:Uncharacterized protein LOC106063511 n=2 Tax=Biomphalaria glabrata TaxID=6526 RepID=A0A9U8E9B7_BIOGL|nr:uncharacterized protein LOC106063511 [Biomphalaria glabrata]